MTFLNRSALAWRVRTGRSRIDGSEVGVDDLVESVVLHDVSFRSAWRRSCFLFFPLAAAVSLCLLSIFFSSFFCCAFILRRASRQCHATIVTSFVKSSANLEEKVTFAENWRTHLIVHILCVSCWLDVSVTIGTNAKTMMVMIPFRSNGL